MVDRIDILSSEKLKRLSLILLDLRKEKSQTKSPYNELRIMSKFDRYKLWMLNVENCLQKHVNEGKQKYYTHVRTLKFQQDSTMTLNTNWLDDGMKLERLLIEQL